MNLRAYDNLVVGFDWSCRVFVSVCVTSCGKSTMLLIGMYFVSPLCNVGADCFSGTVVARSLVQSVCRLIDAFNSSCEVMAGGLELLSILLNGGEYIVPC